MVKANQLLNDVVLVSSISLIYMKLPYSFTLATSSYQAAEDEGSAFGGPVSLNIFLCLFSFGNGHGFTLAFFNCRILTLSKGCYIFTCLLAT